MFLKLFSNRKPPPPPDDQDLVRLFRQTGEMAHLGQLFERHTELVYLICRKYLTDEEESKDATMQVFEKLTRDLRRFEIQDFQPWLHVLAKNHCLQLLRKRKAQPTERLDELSAAGVESAPLLHLPEEERHELELQALEKGLAGLPEEQRRCLELFYFQEKCYKEIAAETNCELGQVKSYIQNGRRNLRIYVEKHHEQS